MDSPGGPWGQAPRAHMDGYTPLRDPSLPRPNPVPCPQPTPFSILTPITQPPVPGTPSPSPHVPWTPQDAPTSLPGSGRGLPTGLSTPCFYPLEGLSTPILPPPVAIRPSSP